jgi:hypothetical protein
MGKSSRHIKGELTVDAVLNTQDSPHPCDLLFDVFDFCSYMQWNINHQMLYSE